MGHDPGPEDDELSTRKPDRPTTADVARLASVSTATVSYVLNNAEGRRISAQTREAVYHAAELLGYRPNLAARNLARGKSGVVLYVVPHVAVGEMPMQAGSRMTAELVALPVELIVALGTPASVAAKRATEAIPIVVQTGDPVAAGLVRDLAHPGGQALPLDKR